MWAGQLEAAERHLGQGLEEGRRIGRPILELQALSDSALLSLFGARAIGEQRARQAIELARAHGWEETASCAASAYVALGGLTLWRGQLAEADGWLDRAERVLRRFAEPTTAAVLYTARGLLEFVRGRYEDAMTAQRAAGRLRASFVVGRQRTGPGRLGESFHDSVSHVVLLVTSLRSAGSSSRVHPYATEDVTDG